MKTRLLALATLSSLLALPAAFADTLGNFLPTTNLNATSAARSNVAWSPSNDGFSTINSIPYFQAYGDSFKLSSSYSGNYALSSLTVWTTDANPLDYSLYLGTSEDILFGYNYLLDQGISPVISLTTYNTGASYLSPSGNDLPIYALTFNFSFTFNAADTVYFSVVGWNDSGHYYAPSLLASNAALSGSEQDFADGVFTSNYNVVANMGEGALFLNSQTINTAGNGWDKSSDLNFTVNVNAVSSPSPSAVPEPSTYGLLGVTGLLGLASLRRLRQRKTA